MWSGRRLGGLDGGCGPDVAAAGRGPDRRWPRSRWLWSRYLVGRARGRGKRGRGRGRGRGAGGGAAAAGGGGGGARGVRVGRRGCRFRRRGRGGGWGPPAAALDSDDADVSVLGVVAEGVGAVVVVGGRAHVPVLGVDEGERERQGEGQGKPVTPFRGADVRVLRARYARGSRGGRRARVVWEVMRGCAHPGENGSSCVVVEARHVVGHRETFWARDGGRESEGEEGEEGEDGGEDEMHCELWSERYVKLDVCMVWEFGNWGL